MLRVNDPFEGWEPPTGREIEQMARQEAASALESLAGPLRAAAAETPGWEPYSDRLGVFSDGERPYLGLQPGDEDEQALHELEYGNERQAPTALMRHTLTQYGPQISRRLGQALPHRGA